MKAILRIDNLSKHFSGLRVLSGVTLDIYEHERHVIIGPNGAGKTTLFNIMSGLFRPSGGKIYFLDRDITALPAYKVARLGISRSFQIINLFPKMTVYENVRNAVVSGRDRRFNVTTFLDRDKGIREETDRLIDLFDLADTKGVPAAELSYGRQRYLELALTVARDPVVVMLDEPTAGLNTEESRNVVGLIQRITEGRTLIMVEHDMDVVFSLADRITVLSNGIALVTGEPGAVRENEEVKRAYLGKK